MAKKKLTEDEIQWILSVDSSQAQQDIHKLTQESKKLTATNKDLKSKMLDLVAAGKKESAEYKNLDAELKKNNEALNKNKQMISELEKKIGLTGLTMNQLKKRARELQNQLNNTSKATNPAQYNKLEKELIDVRNRMDELKVSGSKTKDALSNMFGSIGKGSAAVLLGNIWTKTVSLIGNAVTKVKQIVAEGDKMAGIAQGVERAFLRIADANTLSILQEATKNTVNNLELMKQTVQAHNFKIPLTELGDLLNFAKVRAQETGESVDYLTKSIITGIGRKSPLIIDNLGISATRLKEEVAKTGDFAKAVGKIVREELAKSGAQIDTSTDKAQQRAVLLENIQLSIGQRVKSSMDSVKNSWGDFLSIVNKWVAIPTVQKLREERSELNVLTHSIVSATGHEETRKLLIEELNRLYPSFLENIKIETLSNEELLTRLRNVNTEYDNKIRKQILQDKQLAPLEERKRKAISREMDAILLLNKAVEESGDRLSDTLKEAIKSGAVTEMSLKEISEGINLYTNGASNAWLSGILPAVKRLKEIPAELEEIDKKAKNVTDQIMAYDKLTKKKDNKEIEESKSLIKLKEEELLVAKNMSETTEEEIRLKNQKVAVIEKEITRLKSLGVTTKAQLSDTKSTIDQQLLMIDSAHNDELLRLRKHKAATNQIEQEYNLQVLDENEKYYQNRLNVFNKFQKKISDPKIQADLTKKISETQIALFETQQKKENEAVNALKTNRDKQLRIEEESFTKQRTALEKALATREITKQQHETVLMTLSAESAENRLKINQQHLDDVNSLELTSGDIKADAIKEANTKVLAADLTAAQERGQQQLALQNLVKDFKGEFNITDAKEDAKLQLQVLEATYQARKEMAEKAGMDITELHAAYELAKTNITFQEEQRRAQILQQYGLLSMQEQYELEQEQLKQQRDQGLLEEEEYQKAKSQIQVDYLKKAFDYYKNLFSGAISALQDAEMANIDTKYDAEIERAQGNAEEVERLENEKEAKKLDVQKKYADINFAIKASEIIANTSVSIMKALADLGPIAGPIAASLMGVTGAAQLVAANAEREKIKNMTAKGSSSSSSGKRVVTGKETGGKIDVVRAQDGKEFSADYDPDKRGYVDKPTVIVGEGPTGRSKEWVASNDALENPTVAPFIQLMNESQEKGNIRTVDMNQIVRQRMAGFASGGAISTPVQSPPLSAQPTGSVAAFSDEDKQILKEFITQIKSGVRAYVLRSEFNKEQELDEKSKSIGGK